MKRKLNVKRVVIFVIILILIAISAIGLTFLNGSKVNTTEVSATKVQLLTEEEEQIEEVPEEVIKIAVDTTIDEPLGEKVELNGKEVEIPKSTVAEVNSSEDAEKNKKTGGDAVSQSQAETMFENVGTKSFGIDVSAHNGSINWSQVKAAGVDFAIIRCGFRGQSQGGIYEDKYFKSNVAGAAAAGIKVGIYFYSTAVNEQEALEEAAWTISKIKTYRITYPVVYDFEDFNAYRCASVGGAQATSNAHTFLNAVSSAGYEPMMYANKSDITSRMSRSSFGCKFWLAHYTTQTNYSGSYQMWQYTSRGSVAGISGNVDMDIAYFSYGATAEPKHVHDYSEIVKDSTKAATCTKEGSKVLRCSCGDTKTETLPALGHTYGEWKVTKVATETEKGIEERECSVCGEKETKTISSTSKQNVTNTNSTNTNTNVTNTSSSSGNKTNTNVTATNKTNTNATTNTSSTNTSAGVSNTIQTSTNTTTKPKEENNDSSKTQNTSTDITNTQASGGSSSESNENNNALES